MAKKKQESPRRLVHQLAAEIADKTDTDIVIFAGGMYPFDDIRLNRLVRQNKSHTSVSVFLTTFGGSADSAYRIARCFQEVYKEGVFRIVIDTFCKSAGTLLAIGADEIVMSDSAEIGPLDVQLRKPEEIEERMSGLTATQALSTLRSEVYGTFEDFFVTLRRKTGITSKIAADVASQLTVGLFGPVYSQLEPMRLGENQRAMYIAAEYGKRLMAVADNVEKESLDKLIGEYPSHEFVIDRSEAGDIFKRLRSPDAGEMKIAAAVRGISLDFAMDDDINRPALVDILNISDSSDDEDQPDEKDDKKPKRNRVPTNPEQTDEAAAKGSGNATKNRRGTRKNGARKATVSGSESDGVPV